MCVCTVEIIIHPQFIQKTWETIFEFFLINKSFLSSQIINVNLTQFGKKKFSVTELRNVGGRCEVLRDMPRYGAGVFSLSSSDAARNSKITKINLTHFGKWIFNYNSSVFIFSEARKTWFKKRLGLDWSQKWIISLKNIIPNDLCQFREEIVKSEKQKLPPYFDRTRVVKQTRKSVAWLLSS